MPGKNKQTNRKIIFSIRVYLFKSPVMDYKNIKNGVKVGMTNDFVIYHVPFSFRVRVLGFMFRS